VRGIQKHFPIKGGFFGSTVGTMHAVDGISFTIREGETLGIVGESGCGKSTTARLLMRMMDPVLASMIFDGEGVAENTQAGGVALRDYRRQGGMARALELFELVQVPSAKRRLEAYPHELSGGLRQRAMIAVALACRPKLLLADEPTTALDATVQIQIPLLLQLQQELGMGVVFVTHDLGVAGEIADRGGGDVCRPRGGGGAGDCPDARSLLGATVHAGMRSKRLTTVPGAPPSLETLPSACSFAPRCVEAEPACLTGVPPSNSPVLGRAPRCIHVPDQRVS
jgi:peptide/nickel transport system ATP-binding protein